MLSYRRAAMVLAVVALECCDDEVVAPDTVGVIPSAPADAGVTTSTTVVTFAMDSIFLGEADRAGDPPSNTAWQSFGFNLDGLDTMKFDTNVCGLSPGAPSTNQVDGLDGIDNSWGSTWLPILQSASSLPTPSTNCTSDIRAGMWTLQFQIVGLSPDLHQSATGLTAGVMVSGPLGSTPTFDISTNWPVSPESVDGGTILPPASAVITFANVFVTDGTIVMQNATGPITIPLVIQGVAFPITIHHAIVTMTESNATHVAGTIGGIVDTQEIIATTRVVASHISTDLCGSAFDSTAADFAQAQDILSDGTNAPNVPCNAISIGIGFNASLVANPTTVGVDPPTLTDLCDASDAGVE